MKKYIFGITLILLIIFQTTVLGAEMIKSETGFYVNDKKSVNIYIDIYSYLNNKKEALNIITNAGFENTLFVHQGGRGFTLEELIRINPNDSIEDILRVLDISDFSNRYINMSDNKIIEVIPSIHKGKIEIEPSFYTMPRLSNEFIDVLKREYPEFLYKIKSGWKNDNDTNIDKEEKIISFLDNLKTRIENSGPITDSNFDRIMYISFKEEFLRPIHKDFRNALFNSYGEQIDYSDRNKKLHPDLIPLSESIKGAILNNYFTLLYDTAGLQNNKELDDKLSNLLYEEFGNISAMEFEIIDNEGFNYYQENRGIYNTRINNMASGIITLTNIDYKELKPYIQYQFILYPYINEDVMDITSTTSDYDPLTRKVKILNENGEVIEDVIDKVLIYNITQGIITYQELEKNQKISYIYVSTQNPKDDFEVYFKTINNKWYKLTLVSYSTNQYFINEYIRGEMR